LPALSARRHLDTLRLSRLDSDHAGPIGLLDCGRGIRWIYGSQQVG
jgi:hypothetical protein